MRGLKDRHVPRRMSLGKQMSVWRRGFREGEVLCLKAVGTHTNLIRVAQKECGNVALPTKARAEASVYEA